MQFLNNLPFSSVHEQWKTTGIYETLPKSSSSVNRISVLGFMNRIVLEHLKEKKIYLKSMAIIEKNYLFSFY